VGGEVVDHANGGIKGLRPSKKDKLRALQRQNQGQ
jgi:hypothetical protein